MTFRRSTSSSASVGRSKNERSPTVAAGDIAARGVDEDVDRPDQLARCFELRAVEHVGDEHDPAERLQPLAPAAEHADRRACRSERRGRSRRRGTRRRPSPPPRGRPASTRVSLIEARCVKLSVITDEIDPRLERALDVCEELEIDAVELRTVDGVPVVERDDLEAIRDELDRRGFRGQRARLAVPQEQPRRGARNGPRALARRGARPGRAGGARVLVWREPDPAACAARARRGAAPRG